MKRHGWFGVCFLVLLLITLTWIFGSHGGESRGLAPRPGEDTTSPTIAPGISSPRVTSAAEPSIQEVRTTPEPAPETVSRDGEEADLLSGVVIWRDAGGVLLPPGSGSMKIGVERQGTTHFYPVSIEGGEWSLPRARFQHLRDIEFFGVELDDQYLEIETPAGRFALPESGHVVVHVRSNPASILRVVDAEKGRDLVQVSLVRAELRPFEQNRHPGPIPLPTSRYLARNQASPINLGAVISKRWRRGVNRFLVGAEGHGWTPVTLDFRDGGERLVRLPRGGHLELTPSGPEPPAYATLHLRNREDSTTPLFVGKLGTMDMVRMEHLPVGAYQTSVELGCFLDLPIVLASTEFEIRDMEVTRVPLELIAPPDRDRARIAGHLLLPVAWGEDEVTLRFYPREAPAFSMTGRVIARGVLLSERSGPDVRTYSWSCGGIEPGRYVLRLTGVPFTAEFEVPFGGREDYRFEVPPPARLLVDVLDASTGLAVDTVLRWRPTWPRPAPDGWLHGARRDSELGLFELLVPSGEIELKLTDKGYQPLSETVIVSGDGQRHTLRAEPAFGLRVRLLYGDAAVELPARRDLLPSPVAPGTGAVTRTEYGPLEWEFTLSEPGSYRLELPEVPGYVRPDPIEVQVAEGEFTSQVVRLERLD